eukprot:6384337-Pyramimonas_sp.AAC.1
MAHVVLREGAEQIMGAAFGAAGLLTLNGQRIRIFPATHARAPMRRTPGTESALDDHVRGSPTGRGGRQTGGGAPTSRHHCQNGLTRSA